MRENGVEPSSDVHEGAIVHVAADGVYAGHIVVADKIKEGSGEAIKALKSMQDDNDTMAALKKYFTGEVKQKAIKTMPFTSVKKYGGVSFHEDETYVLGAPEIILANSPNKYENEINKYSAKGCRVLLLALYDGSLDDEKLTADIMPLALILLSNKIRDEAPETFKYFADQGVDVKVISGDNPVTVSEVAKRAGIANAEKFVDARTLTSDEKIAAAAGSCTVFGRVTPDQKKKLVLALKAQGHTVAMTGDGVNDVLALKEADCSIAMASGSDVACQASHIVLMDSNFASMPSVVAEGRRVINNIERSASLYLVKNIFTFVLAFITLFFTLPYPYTPAQLSLVNALTIGVPSFILAMEPNENLVRGKFMRNVLFRALPTALTDLFLVVGAMLFYVAFNLDDSMGPLCRLPYRQPADREYFRYCFRLAGNPGRGAVHGGARAARKQGQYLALRPGLPDAGGMERGCCGRRAGLGIRRIQHFQISKGVRRIRPFSRRRRSRGALCAGAALHEAAAGQKILRRHNQKVRIKIIRPNFWGGRFFIFCAGCCRKSPKERWRLP